MSARPNSFSDPERTFTNMPRDIGVTLGRVDVGRGRQELFEHQVPALLQALARQTRVESIRASVAIEGVEVDPARAAKLAQAVPPKKLRDRDEREFAGYRDAIDRLMREKDLKVIEPLDLLDMHRELFKFTEAVGGRLKSEDNVIQSRDESGGPRRTVFRPPSHRETEGLLVSLCSSYKYAIENEIAHPLALVGAFILDLLAIHPVEDGNGRMARLATTHELLRLGYGVARYISVEQLIYDNKNAYYDALEQSQKGWLEGKQDIWPWIRYLAVILGEAYDDFENRVAVERGSRMTKAERVRHWVETAAPKQFSFRSAVAALPGISQPTIRLELNRMRDEKLIRAEGRGPKAVWIKLV